MDQARMILNEDDKTHLVNVWTFIYKTATMHDFKNLLESTLNSQPPPCYFDSFRNVKENNNKKINKMKAYILILASEKIEVVKNEEVREAVRLLGIDDHEMRKIDGFVYDVTKREERSKGLQLTVQPGLKDRIQLKEMIKELERDKVDRVKSGYILNEKLNMKIKELKDRDQEIVSLKRKHEEDINSFKRKRQEEQVVPLQNRIADLERQLTKGKDKIKELTGVVSGYENTSSKSKKEVESSKRHIVKLKEDITRKSTENGILRDKLNEIIVVKAKLKHELDQIITVQISQYKKRIEELEKQNLEMTRFLEGVKQSFITLSPRVVK